MLPDRSSLVLRTVRTPALRARESGVAIIMVIVVLMALVIIAVPFSISMRNHGESATYLLNRKRALKECEALRNIAFERLKETHPHFDLESPYYDDENEVRSDLKKYDFGFNTTDPRGKIWSLASTDLQGRINLNGVSIYLMANLLNERTWLEKGISGDEVRLDVTSTMGFPPDGFVWVEGEAIEYASKTADSFDDIERSLAVEALKESIKGLPPDHGEGVEVLGYRSFLIASWCYKWRPGRISFFPTTESVRSISVGNEISLLRDDFDALDDSVTVNSGYPSGRRFVNPQRVLSFDRDDKSVLEVEEGRFMGPGSIVRIRCGSDQHYSMVLLAREDFASESRSWKLLLQDPLSFEPRSEATGVIDVLARPAVNINTASEKVLEALLTGLSLSPQGMDWVKALTGDAPGGAGSEAFMESALEERDDEVASERGGRRIAPGEARKIAAAIKRAPVTGFDDLYARLTELNPSEEDSSLPERQIWAVLLNALNSNDAYLSGGTAPFCFLSEGCFQIDTAVSDNYFESGREMAHQFMRDIAWASPAGSLLAVFAAQRDFEEQRRLTREGRHYATFPNPMDAVPDRIPVPCAAPGIILQGIAPAEESEGSYVQLAPTRTTGDRCLHFDAGDSDYVARGALSLYPSDTGKEGDLPFFMNNPSGFLCGEQALHLQPGEPPVSFLSAYGGRMAPFSVEMWYRFDELDREHYIFDCGVAGMEVNNRAYLFYNGESLVFRVADATIPASNPASDEPLEQAEIRYDFSDLPLETGVFYHMACMAAGTRPSDLSLFVDGVARGKHSFMTHLKEDLQEDEGKDEDTGVGSYRSSYEIKVEDASTFPSRDGVIRIGNEIIEYTSRTDDTFVIDPLPQDPFGGRHRRGSRSHTHKATTAVELYGYVTTLMSEVIPRGDQVLGVTMGPFRVARVKNDSSSLVTQDITLSHSQKDFFPLEVGRGFLGDRNSAVLPLQGIEGAGMNDDMKAAFSPGGGYALVFSEFPQDLVNVPLKSKYGNAGAKTLQPPYTKRVTDLGRPVFSEAKSSDGQPFFINGVSILFYDHFTGQSLEGIVWGKGPEGQPREFINSGGTDNNNNDLQHLTHPRCFVTKYTNKDVGGTTEYPRIFVIPLSFSAGKESSVDFFNDYFSSPNGHTQTGRTRSEIVQVGLDFEKEDKNEEQTEWVRYDSIERNRFCRENLKNSELARLWGYLSPTEIINSEGTFITDAALAEKVNRIIHFRGQHGTKTSRHSMDAKVLPVFRMKWDGAGLFRPGRNDFITLISEDLETDVQTEPESHRINYCNCYLKTEDASGSGGFDGIYHDRDHDQCVLIGLRSPVLGEYHRTVFQEEELVEDLLQQLKTKQDDPYELVSDKVSEFFRLESRSYTRMLKFPSGELPAETPETFVLGGDLMGEISPALGCIDEVRFRSFATPHAALPKHYRYVLQTEVDETRHDQIQICPDVLQSNFRALPRILIEAYRILETLPGDAGLLQINDEILAYTEVDVDEGIIMLAPNGRGMLGTEPACHDRGEAVTLLNFPTLSILQNRISETDSLLALKNSEGFPAEGAVLINEEVLGYSRHDGDFLMMPEGPSFDNAGRDMGLLRGRFGTAAANHLAGEVVYSLPVRYLDLYPALQSYQDQANASGNGAETMAAGSLQAHGARDAWAPPLADVPEAAFFPFSVYAPGAFFNEVTWVEERQGPGAVLDIRVRVNGVEDWSRSPLLSRDLFSFSLEKGSKTKNPVLRQGDRIDLRVYTRYEPGAFDPLDFISNAWKYTPRLKALGVEYVQPTRIVRHEEWR
ncbi:MAG: hypothetical protein ABIK28_04260 [Planctomycetota bacterium]